MTNITAAEHAAHIEHLRNALNVADADIKSTRDALKTLIAERDRIAEEISATKKARFAAIAAEEKAAKIAALRAELAKLEGDAPNLSLVA